MYIVCKKEEFKRVSTCRKSKTAVAATSPVYVGKIHRWGCAFTVTSSPTANCQVMSVSNFADIVVSSPDPIEQVREIEQFTRKPLMLVDVKERLSARIEEVFKERIHLKAPYTSTNNSEMVIYLINVKNI
jgi:hypothetical protein